MASGREGYQKDGHPDLAIGWLRLGYRPDGLERGQSRAHIGKMPQYVDEAFIVLVHSYAPDGSTLREEYVVGCSTREAAEEIIKIFFRPEADIKVFASPLGTSETAMLNLMPNEIRPRHVG